MEQKGYFILVVNSILVVAVWHKYIPMYSHVYTQGDFNTIYACVFSIAEESDNMLSYLQPWQHSKPTVGPLTPVLNLQSVMNAAQIGTKALCGKTEITGSNNSGDQTFKSRGIWGIFYILMALDHIVSPDLKTYGNYHR